MKNVESVALKNYVQSAYFDSRYGLQEILIEVFLSLSRKISGLLIISLL